MVTVAVLLGLEDGFEERLQLLELDLPRVALRGGLELGDNVLDVLEKEAPFTVGMEIP